MAARIIIRRASDYIIDSADSGSTSTTTGVQLDLDIGQPMNPNIQQTEFRWPIMYAHVTAASEAALKTAVDALIENLRNCSGASIVYQQTSGTDLIVMSNTVWPECEAGIEWDQANLKADVAFSFVGKNAGQVSGGAGDPAGLIAPITWQYEITGGGIAGMVATAVFGPTVVNGSITAGARQNAVAWINTMRNTSNYPSWLAAAFREVQAVIEFEQKRNVGTVGESSYDPAVVTMAFREMAATLHAAGTFPSQCKSLNYTVVMAERPPINMRSGQMTPGFDFEIVGNAVLKTEGNTAFNGSETSLADNAIEAAADAAIEAVISMFRSVHASRSLVQLGRAVYDVDPVQGNMTFRVRFTTDEAIRRWDERCNLQNIPMKTHSRASRGADWKYEAKGGPLRVITHSLEIDSLYGAQSYRPPPLDANWDEMDNNDLASFGSRFDNGEIIYTASYNRSWRYVNNGDGNHGGGATSSGAARTVDTIGSNEGRI